MPELMPTDHTAQIVWMGKVPLNRANIRSEAVTQALATYAGFADDYHGGLTRASCVRVKAQHPKGTQIRNVRQLTILSAEELAAIARDIDVAALDPQYLGASMVVQGIPDFTHLPPSARLQADNGTTLVVDMLNAPCTLPSREIERDTPGHGKAFKKAAEGRRGVCSWVEREGQLAVGDHLRLHIPSQRPWTGR